jgi:DUF1365 family protein
MCLAWLDLGELDRVFRGRWFWSTTRPTLAWLKRSDYLGDPAVPIDQAVRDLVEQQTGARPAGPIRMLTHLRMFGHCFNPVTFYYCYDSGSGQVQTVVAEITNTPWNERHAYVLPASAGERRAGQLRFRLDKRFHVSPFMPMDIDYDWRFTEPGERLAVSMVNRRDGATLFDAALSLQRREIDAGSLASALVGHPFATLQVVAAIYWQALRLWLKRVPFHVHPAKQE